MAAKTAERELISMRQKVREVLNIAMPYQTGDAKDSDLYPLLCDFVVSYRKSKEK